MSGIFDLLDVIRLIDRVCGLLQKTTRTSDVRRHSSAWSSEKQNGEIERLPAGCGGIRIWRSHWGLLHDHFPSPHSVRSIDNVYGRVLSWYHSFGICLGPSSVAANGGTMVPGSVLYLPFLVFFSGRNFSWYLLWELGKCATRRL